jgi:hypothetical protein
MIDLMENKFTVFDHSKPRNDTVAVPPGSSPNPSRNVGGATEGQTGLTPTPSPPASEKEKEVAAGGETGNGNVEMVEVKKEKVDEAPAEVPASVVENADSAGNDEKKEEVAAVESAAAEGGDAAATEEQKQ